MTTHTGQTVRINVWQKLRTDRDGEADSLITEVMRLDQPYQTDKGAAATHVLQATFEFVYTPEHELRYEMAKMGFDHHEALLAEAKESATRT
jgi:hypothetical protein